MQANGGRIVVNPSFQEWVYLDEKSPRAFQTPMKRQVTYCVEETQSANSGAAIT